MRLAARCSQKLLVSISYVPFRAADYAKSDHPSPPGCLLLAPTGHGPTSDLSPLSGVKRKSNFGAVRSVDDPGRRHGSRVTMLAWNYAARVLLFPDRATFAFLADFVATNPVSVGAAAAALLPELSTEVVIISR